MIKWKGTGLKHLEEVYPSPCELFGNTRNYVHGGVTVIEKISLLNIARSLGDLWSVTDNNQYLISPCQMFMYTTYIHKICLLLWLVMGCGMC